MRRIGCLTAILLVTSCPACHTEFAVRVEKLDGVASRWDAAADEALAAVRGALAGLDALCLDCRAVVGDGSFETDLAALAEAQEAARELMPLADDLAGRRAAGRIGGHSFVAQVAALDRRAAELVPPSESAYLLTLSGSDPRGTGTEDLRRFAGRTADELDRLSEMLGSAATAAPGFGGFRQAGMYQINPGDPAYEAVLKASPSPTALTSVSARIAGDAGVMLVQESPGQIRLYQISSDPLRLMQNAAFILDKVLQAAVKFSAEGRL